MVYTVRWFERGRQERDASRLIDLPGILAKSVRGEFGMRQRRHSAAKALFSMRRSTAAPTANNAKVWVIAINP